MNNFHSDLLSKRIIMYLHLCADVHEVVNEHEHIFVRDLIIHVAVLCFNRFLLGMHAFGLEETNMYERAEKQARKVDLLLTLQIKKLIYYSLNCVNILY